MKLLLTKLRQCEVNQRGCVSWYTPSFLFLRSIHLTHYTSNNTFKPQNSERGFWHYKLYKLKIKTLAVWIVSRGSSSGIFLQSLMTSPSHSHSHSVSSGGRSIFSSVWRRSVRRTVVSEHCHQVGAQFSTNRKWYSTFIISRAQHHV